MDKQLIINANSMEVRLALLENGRMSELFIERKKEQILLGSIFKGVVTRVLPGMNAAFVDIGLDKAAFLFGGDVYNEEYQNLYDDPDSDEDTIDSKIEKIPIEKKLREGQTVLVQVSKEAISTKGPRVTMHITLPGRYIVLIPLYRHIGVSRRIENETEKDRLKNLMENLVPNEYGCIARTAADGVDEEILKMDLHYLLRKWERIETTINFKPAPNLLYKDLEIIHKVIRDIYNDEISQIVIDDYDLYVQLGYFLEESIPGAKEKLSYYKDPIPIFDIYEVEMDISRALSSRVELPSGGYLILEQTEALTSFDVNTGRYVGKASARQTILETNIEAAAKVVEQLRIRNIGGIIVVDFIDMEEVEDREIVYETLLKELKHDRARNNVLKISELGLVQMTRKRTSDSIGRKLLSDCPYCEGKGQVKSLETELFDLYREIIRCHLQTKSSKLKVKLRQDLKDLLEHSEHNFIDELSDKFFLTISIEPSGTDIDHLREPVYEVISD